MHAQKAIQNLKHWRERGSEQLLFSALCCVAREPSAARKSSFACLRHDFVTQHAKTARAGTPDLAMRVTEEEREMILGGNAKRLLWV